MWRNVFRIVATIVVAILVSSLLWDLSMNAVRGQGGRKPNTENFDIRDNKSKDALSKFERRLERISAKRKEKNDLRKHALKDARETKSRSIPGLDVLFCSLTNCPEVIEMKGKQCFF